jgi:hypothetical protein
MFCNKSDAEGEIFGENQLFQFVDKLLLNSGGKVSPNHRDIEASTPISYIRIIYWLGRV